MFVGSEHILWSIAKGDDTVASAVLNRYGFCEELIRDIIEQYDQDAAEEGDVRLMQFSEDAERVVELAEAQAKETKYKRIEPEHLLLGILLEEKSAAAELIVSMGADLDDMREELLSRFGTDRSGLPAERKP